MKTNEQLLDEITAVMADTWLAACNRRFIIPTLVPNKFMIIDQQGSRLFGPASGDECRVFVHRAAALDVLRVLGTERVAGASMIAASNGELRIAQALAAFGFSRRIPSCVCRGR